jgi:hypothetical protein
MSFEWPTPSERKKNLKAYRHALAVSKCKFTEDEKEAFRNMMALPPSERLRRAVMMILPKGSPLVRRRPSR